MPFHIRTIKNCSFLTEKALLSLRINFHNPNQTNKDVILAKPENESLWIKELTFKSCVDSKNLNNVHGELREALRIIKQQDSMTHKSADAKEEDQHLCDEPLISTKQPLILKDLILRPAIQGKKTIGEL